MFSAYAEIASNVTWEILSIKSNTAYPWLNCNRPCGFKNGSIRVVITI